MERWWSSREEDLRSQKRDEDAKSGQLSECCFTTWILVASDFVSIIKRKKRNDSTLSAPVFTGLWSTGEDHFMGRVGRMRLSGLWS